MIRGLLILCLIASSFNLHSQEADFILSKFFATQVEEEVLLRWTITAGNTCQDTYVERSEDGINYERIGLIGGVCGSPDESITYDFYDTLPLVNRISYYRLLLGQYGFTSAETLEFIQYNDQGFLLAPNPFIDFTKLRFENEGSEDYTLIVSDIMGRNMHEMTTSGDEFIIKKDNLGSGIFIYQVLKNGKVLFEGKLVTF